MSYPRQPGMAPRLPPPSTLLAPAEVDRLPAPQLTTLASALDAESALMRSFIAQEDADAVVQATAGMGTDEDRLIGILCNRTKAQLDACSAACVARHGKTLAPIVGSDVSGSFGKIIVYALMDVDNYGAAVFHKATQGAGTDEGAILDLINTRTNAELAAIRAKYEAQHGKPLIDVLNSEFGSFSKHLRKVLVQQFLGTKSESTAVDAGAAATCSAAHKAGRDADCRRRCHRDSLVTNL